MLAKFCQMHVYVGPCEIMSSAREHSKTSQEPKSLLVRIAQIENYNASWRKSREPIGIRIHTHIHTVEHNLLFIFFFFCVRSYITLYKIEYGASCRELGWFTYKRECIRERHNVHKTFPIAKCPEYSLHSSDTHSFHRATISCSLTFVIFTIISENC